jgi:hypothetical protein
LGGGFYNLYESVGGEVACPINSAANFLVKIGSDTSRTESCPFFFSWSGDMQGHPQAQMIIDSTLWRNPVTPSMYFGFHEQIPGTNVSNGQNYFGGRNLPLIDNAHVSVELSGGVSVSKTETSKGRLLAGISWFVPSMKKTIVLEMNLQQATNATPEPLWSLTTAAVENTACPTDQKCLNLGAQNWGLSALTWDQANFTLHWSEIAKKLVELGHLPKEAYGPYQVKAVYFGPEVVGRVNAQLNVSRLKTYIE